MTEYLYRAFGTVKWVDAGRFGTERTPITTICVDALPILRRTPEGAYIKDPLTCKERWVATHGKKRFACPTEEEAIVSLRARSKRRLQHLSAATRKTTEIYNAVKRGPPETVERLRDGYYVGTRRASL